MFNNDPVFRAVDPRTDAQRERAREILKEVKEQSAKYEAERLTWSALTAKPDAARRCLEAALKRDEIEAAREILRPDFATSCARAANRRAAEAEYKKQSPALPRIVADIESDPAAAMNLEQLEARIECLRDSLEVRDDKEAGTKALLGEERRKVRSSLNLALSIRSSRLLPELAKNRAQAVSDFLDDSEEQTGMSMSPEQYAEAEQKRLKLSDMAKEITRRLEEAGINAHRDSGDMKLWQFFIHTGMLVELPQYRRICINPVIAAQSRAGILASLEFFTQEHKFCRFWTFTTGQRCFASDIPARLDEFNKRLRKLNHWMRKNYGVEIIIRATEFGTLESHEDGNRVAERDTGRINFELNAQTGKAEPTYHPHFHCVVYSRRGYIEKDRWTELCEKVRARWKCHCDFSGVIENPREIVKYVTKPGDVLKLDLPQLREFFEVTTNRRLVVPMGELKREIAARKAAGKKLLRKKSRKMWHWREVFDHNKTLSEAESPEQRQASDEMADANAFDHEHRLAMNAAPNWVDVDDVTTIFEGEVFKTRGGRELVGGREVRMKDKRDFCKVVAFIPPAAGPTRRKENRLLVLGDRFDLAAVKRHPLYQQLHDRTFTAWVAGEELARSEAAALGSGIYVHTGTVSVPGGPPDPGRVRVKNPVQLVMETA